METVNARGASGTVYFYQVLEGAVTWHDVPANYMFAFRGVGGWKIAYIGQCDSARARLPSHERWAEAVRVYGATHILTHPSSPNEDVRKTEERDLIQAIDPPMNVQHRVGNTLLTRGFR